jgi:hypothetical protein
MDKSLKRGALGIQGAELGGDPLIQRYPRRLLMNSMTFIGLDLHKEPSDWTRSRQGRKEHG